MTEPLVAESLEQIIVAGVALTTVALTAARPGLDLTFPQWRVMVVLGEEPAGVRISKVAYRVGVTLPATSRQIRRLERRGLVEVAPDLRDRRAAVASLTESGWDARDAVVAYRAAQLRTLAEPFESNLEMRRALATVAAALAPRGR